RCARRARLREPVLHPPDCGEEQRRCETGEDSGLDSLEEPEARRRLVDRDVEDVVCVQATLGLAFRPIEAGREDAVRTRQTVPLRITRTAENVPGAVEGCWTLGAWPSNDLGRRDEVLADPGLDANPQREVPEQGATGRHDGAARETPSARPSPRRAAPLRARHPPAAAQGRRAVRAGACPLARPRRAAPG